jgi:RimJ/RimL family protein N-acetyltransferase
MTAVSELETERLLLRQWQQSDLPAFAALNADAEVMAHFPATLSVAESNKLAKKLSRQILEQGWGLWALERKTDGAFIGFTGLQEFTGMPFLSADETAVEISWRLARGAWGQGLASEAARGAANFAFTRLALSELYSFTACQNSRSIAVMIRLGMQACPETFRHPRLSPDSPLSEHALYRLQREDWLPD